MSLRGRGWFIWQIPRCEGGVASAIEEACKKNGIAVKVKQCKAAEIGIYIQQGADLIVTTTPLRGDPGLLESARALLQSCPCLHGCPTCVGPTLEVGNRAKEVALAIVNLLLDGP